MSDAPRLTVFMLLRTTPAWLALSRPERAGIAGKAFSDAMTDGAVSLRYFDAEAFHGRVTDVAMFDAQDLFAYYAVVERLRDSPLFSVPYFQVVDVVPALEDGYQAFEHHEATARLC